MVRHSSAPSHYSGLLARMSLAPDGRTSGPGPGPKSGPPSPARRGRRRTRVRVDRAPCAGQIFQTVQIFTPPRRTRGVSESDATLLRHELHRMHEEHEREKKEWESGMKSILDDDQILRNAVADLRAEIVRLERRLATKTRTLRPPKSRCRRQSPSATRAGASLR